MQKKKKPKKTVAKGGGSRMEASGCSWIYFVPVINIFYDMLFDSAPQIAQINESMSTFGLIAGLMVTVAQAVMNTLETEHVEAYRETNFGGSYDAFALWAPMGFALLSAAMLSVVIHFLASSCSDVENMAPEVYRSWWFFVRWNLATTFVLTVLGLTGVMLGAYTLFNLQHALSEEEALKLKSFTSGTLCGGVMGGAGVCLPWVIMSLGLARAKWVESHLEQVPLSVDSIYEQLEAYRLSCAEDNFFCMEQDEFLAWLNASMGPRKSMTSMTLEFAKMAFDMYKNEEMQKHLRSNNTAEGNCANNVRSYTPRQQLPMGL